MKKNLIFLLILFPLFLFGQTDWKAGEDILTFNGNSYWVSDADSVFFDDDTLYIAGAETLEIYVHTGKTLGMISFYGTIQNKDTIGYSSTADSVYFYMSRHRGNGLAKNTNIAETFFAMDSVENDGSTVGSFDFRPFENSTLNQVHTAFYTLRIYGKANIINAVWIKQEIVNAYR